MNKINNFSVLSVTALFGLTLLLNTTNKISACALIFTAVIIITNFIAESYGRDRAIITLATCCALSLASLWNGNYFISGMKVNILFGSFAALMVSAYYSASIYLKLKNNYSFYSRSFISLVIASVIDSFILSIALLNNFSLSKLASIFINDTIVKFSYSATICLIMLAGVYLFQQKNIVKN